MKRGPVVWTILTAAVLLAPAAARARIKLAALPVRERVEIQLDNGRYTLVEEERIVPLLKSTLRTGNNRIDFSWSNTQIDKDSIQFRPIAIREAGKFRPIRKVGGKPEINVINVAYPPNENALVWEVYAREACAVKVRVSYLIGNLTRSFAYRALADKAETKLTLKKYIQLRNYSGEAFLGEDWAALTPLDGKMKLYLGEARDIVCTRIIKDSKRHSVRGNLRHQEIWIKYEVENFKDKPVTLDIVEQINRLAREYGGNPHGDAEWEQGKDTSKEIAFDFELGGATPKLSVKLPARPKDKNEKVAKQTFIFHLTIKNLW